MDKAELTWQMIVLGILAILVLAVVAFMFTSQIKKGYNEFKGWIKKTEKDDNGNYPIIQDIEKMQQQEQDTADSEQTKQTPPK